MLANILNFLKNDLPAKLLEQPTFSDDNPLHKAAKRRGRPRKKPAQEQTVFNNCSSIDDENMVDTNIQKVTSERRTKRQSRPPVRYVDEVIPTTLKSEAISQDEEEEDLQKSSSSVVILPLRTTVSNNVSRFIYIQIVRFPLKKVTICTKQLVAGNFLPISIKSANGFGKVGHIDG